MTDKINFPFIVGQRTLYSFKYNASINVYDVPQSLRFHEDRRGHLFCPDEEPIKIYETLDEGKRIYTIAITIYHDCPICVGFSDSVLFYLNEAFIEAGYELTSTRKYSPLYPKIIITENPTIAERIWTKLLENCKTQLK